MEISKELKQSIVNNNSSIKSVEVEYPNGKTVSGFITQLKLMDLDVTICRHKVPRGQDPHHYIDFDNAEKIKLIYENGTEEVF